MGLNHHLNYLFAVVFIVNFCLASNVFERDPGPPRENEGFVYKSRQERSLSDNETNINSSKEPSYKKWQVGRVSRKHFEIINMLWRKTKVFIDVESTTFGKEYNNNNGSKIINKRQESNRNLRQKDYYVSRPIFYTTTPSFIEFYYLDEKEDQMKSQDPITDKFDKFFNIRRTTMLNFARPVIRHSPFFLFHVEPNYKRPTTTTRTTPKPMNKKKRRNPQQELIDTLTESRNYSNLKNILKPENRIKLTDLIKNNTLFGKRLITVKVYLNGSHVTKTTQTVKHVPETTTISTTTTSISPCIHSTTVYDKIKFFELYDSHTLAPKQRILKIEDDDINNSIESNEINHKIIKVQSIDQSIDNCNNQSEPSHNKQLFNYGSFTTPNKIENVSKARFQRREGSPYVLQDKNALKLILNQSTPSPSTVETKLNRQASWFDYPFVSVYVYEPTQTHCDAAGISSHWLIAAGSCLSRHHLVHSVEARSAFVTYCGNSWRHPERIAYVKYSVVHPKFHPKDPARRHLYNIGLIQVSSSMSSCSHWSPISLMSHQFAASSQGSTASAVGWGLDRFGTKYMSENRPPWTLMVYEGLVYCDSCPGSIAYSKAKRQDPESGANNVFCLLLPPYSGEETDPVHGGMLLVGGKLIALYLQEERRSWGAQSAQYTGVWRLIPWVMNSAREPEDVDAFSADV